LIQQDLLPGNLAGLLIDLLDLDPAATSLPREEFKQGLLRLALSKPFPALPGGTAAGSQLVSFTMGLNSMLELVVQAWETSPVVRGGSASASGSPAPQLKRVLSSLRRDTARLAKEQLEPKDLAEDMAGLGREGEKKLREAVDALLPPALHDRTRRLFDNLVVCGGGAEVEGKPVLRLAEIEAALESGEADPETASAWADFRVSFGAVSVLDWEGFHPLTP
jgi:hypothetical protein